MCRPKPLHNKALANMMKKRAASTKLPSPPAKKSSQDEKCSLDSVPNDNAASKTPEDAKGTDFTKSDVISNHNLIDNSYQSGILHEIMGKCEYTRHGDSCTLSYRIKLQFRSLYS